MPGGEVERSSTTRDSSLLMRHSIMTFKMAPQGVRVPEEHAHPSRLARAGSLRKHAVGRVNSPAGQGRLCGLHAAGSGGSHDQS